MIIQAEIITQPNSGEFSERIYDNESVWNSQYWTFVKFTEDDYTEWCGQFRGFSIQVAISAITNIVLVSTSSYLFQLDRETGNLKQLEQHSKYHNLTVAPNGDFILADYYNFEKVTLDIKDKEQIESPFQMDEIEFINWENSKLKFTCKEFMNWEITLKMTYDSSTDKIEIENG